METTTNFFNQIAQLQIIGDLHITIAKGAENRLIVLVMLQNEACGDISSSRLGSCIRRAIDSGATGSGGETMAPRTQPTGHEKPSTQWLAAAVTMVVKSTQPTASKEMGRRLNLNALQLISTADE